MAIDGLTIIGESINDSVPSTHKIFEAGNIDDIKALAQSQDEGGAAYIDVNVGPRSAQFLADMVRAVQSVTRKPLSIDTPDPQMAKVALQAYDPKLAGDQIPVLNSISLLRSEMFELTSIQPFKPILLASERLENGRGEHNATAQQVYDTAKAIVAQAQEHHIPVHDCIIDPAICPIGSDSDGHLQRIIQAMRLIHNDPQLAGVHMSVGLSNFTVMLPAKRPDGSPVKSALESAFLTMAIPLGLDHVIGSVKRNYQLLPQDHPAMICLRECLDLEGFDVIMRVQEFYSA
jgi:cobalamin-dependent methionine synthase I